MESNVTNATNATAEESAPFQKSLEFVFEVVLLSSVGLLGIIGNMAALLVFSRQKRQLKFHRLMMTLAAFDLLYILLCLVLFTVPGLSPSYRKNGMHFYVLPRILPLAQMTLTGSIYSTLAITVERYLTVCHPFYTVSHKWAARRYIIPIVTFSMLYNLPKFFELRTGYNPEQEGSDKPVYSIDPTALRSDPLYIKIYCIWMNFVFMGVGPFCLLAALNLLTLRSLILQSRGSSTNVPKRHEVALAKVSLTIVFIFIICHSVKWIPNLYELARLAREDKRRTWPPWVESTTHISHFLMVLNSSVNFYIYCGKHENNALARLCRACGLIKSPASNGQQDFDSHTTEDQRRRSRLRSGDPRDLEALVALNQRNNSSSNHNGRDSTIVMTTSVSATTSLGSAASARPKATSLTGPAKRDELPPLPPDLLQSPE